MYVTARKYADGIGVHIRTVERWAREGTVEARRVNRRWYVKDEPPQEAAATAQRVHEK